jgi:protein-L-isoaspartate O-methyltransferase
VNRELSRLSDIRLLKTPAVYAAMQAVNRRRFVHALYDGETLLPLPLSEEEVDELCNGRRTFITHLDAESQSPVGALLAPDVMVSFLEGLKVQPGLRVLEIGPGNGYGSALLSILVGERGSVTSCWDAAGDRCDTAQRLRDLGFGQISFLTLAELDNLPAGAFDRVVVWTPLACVPTQWARLLAEDGVMVVVKNGRNCAHQLCVVPKGGQLIGTIRASFRVGLFGDVPQLGYPSHGNRALHLTDETGTAETLALPTLNAWLDSGWLTLVDETLPTVRVDRLGPKGNVRPVIFDVATSSAIYILDDGTFSLSGAADNLLRSVTATYQEWNELMHPDLSRLIYALETQVNVPPRCLGVYPTPSANPDTLSWVLHVLPVKSRACN